MAPTKWQRVAALSLVVLCAGTACRGDGEKIIAHETTTSAAAVAASPSASAEPITRSPVHLAPLFAGVKGYHFRPAAQAVRKKAREAFRRIVGHHLFAVRVVRAVKDLPEPARHNKRKKEGRRNGAKAQRRRDRPTRVPPEATVVVLSVRLPVNETVDGFQTKVVEALSQDTSATLSRIHGRRLYYSKDATRRHLSRLFFFYRGSVFVQIFGKPLVVRNVARALLP
jgi:hypothetical protein